MITLFRRIRQKLIDSGSVTKYMFYATGEILLVVVGILIALQVNNWNEQRRNEQQIQQIFQGIQEDLINDIEETQAVRIWYADRNPIVEKIIRGDYKGGVPDGYERVLVYQTALYWFPFAVNQSSFDNLTRNQSIMPDTYQRVYKSLDMLYTQRQKFLTTQLQYMDSFVENYRNQLYEEKEWILDYAKGKYDDSAQQYFTSDPYHKRKLARYDQISQSLQRVLEVFHRSAMINYLMIESQIPSDRPLPKEIKEFISSAPKDEIPDLEGSYVHRESGTPLEIWRSGEIYVVVTEELTLVDSNTYIVQSLSADTLVLDRNNLKILPERDESGNIQALQTFMDTQNRGRFVKVK